jgi:hypothetical protein
MVAAARVDLGHSLHALNPGVDRPRTAHGSSAVRGLSRMAARRALTASR